jgi:Tachylectin
MRRLRELLFIVCSFFLLTASSLCQAQDCRNGLDRMSFTPSRHTFEILYTVKPDGSLWWQRDEIGIGPGATFPSASGGRCSVAEMVSHSFTAPKHVGDGWGGVQDILSGGETILYALKKNGDLDWYRHYGYLDGSVKWGGATLVGTGWNSATRVIAMGRGIFYGQMATGEMLWNKHENYLTGQGFYAGWAQPAVKVMGLGNYKVVFGGGEGVFYAVNDKGELVWFRHKTYLQPLAKTGPAILEDWQGGRTIGTGWGGFSKLFCAGRGHIYGLLPSGELRAYDHVGWQDGSSIWGQEVKIGDGWGDCLFIFAAMHS